VDNDRGCSEGVARAQASFGADRLAVVLGVAMISGTYILTDTITRAFTNVFSVSYRHTDAVISGRQLVSGANSAPTVPASLLARVRELPDVAAAAGSYLFDRVTLVDRHGRTIASGGPFGSGDRSALRRRHGDAQ
jgi:putative ABC transport system permease protein